MKSQLLKEAEEAFDKHFEGYWRGHSIGDEIKFFNKRWIERAYESGRMAGVRDEMLRTGLKKENPKKVGRAVDK